MSKNNLIALAIAAALASPAAYAVNVTPATPDVFPSNVFTSDLVEVTNGGVIKIAAAADDNYLGRSTGYNIRVTLDDGAVFARDVVIQGPSPDGGTTPGPIYVQGLNNETVTIAGGGTTGSNVVTFSVVPATGVVEGDGIQLNANALLLEKVKFLAAGASLKIDVRVGDPVGGQELAAKNNTAIASAEEAWVVNYSAPGNVVKRIDVGSASGKTLFSSNGLVNTADTAIFGAGSVTVSLNPNLTQFVGLDTAVATAPLSITGGDFSAFLAANGGSVSLQSVAACDGSGTTIAATVASNGQSAAIAATTTVDALNANKFICFTADTGTVIAAQDLSASLQISQTSFNSSPVFVESGKLLDMAYNGAVKQVWHFNPSVNVAQESFMRITNTSATAGLFTIDSKCDNATSGAAVKFNLDAGRSILLTSSDLEKGNANKGLSGAAGECVAVGSSGVTGKRRLTITGEVGTMEVQNFIRNVNSAGTTTTNVNNAD